MLEIKKNEMKRLAIQCPEHLKRTPAEIAAFEDKKTMALLRLMDTSKCGPVRPLQRQVEKKHFQKRSLIKTGGVCHGR